MPRKLVRASVTDSEEMRCCMYGMFGGFHHRLIAKRLYGNGNPRYSPSDTEIRRVGMILKRNGISTRAWRNGATAESEHFLNRLSRIRETAKPKLRIVA